MTTKELYESLHLLLTLDKLNLFQGDADDVEHRICQIEIAYGRRQYA